MNWKTADPFLEPFNSSIYTVSLDELNNISAKDQNYPYSLTPQYDDCILKTSLSDLFSTVGKANIGWEDDCPNKKDR